ncbi:MAG: HVO_2753 family zinc finger protein [Methanothrix sp.]|uniref:HVO_2753 family zinc finger protein n=2 Tax=Methanothrix sp. TaxID=90426 RepID=UPI003D28F42B
MHLSCFLGICCSDRKVYSRTSRRSDRRSMKDVPEKCISCGVTLLGTGGVRFPCPSCGVIIARCNRCKKQSNIYTCKSCGFTGP